MPLCARTLKHGGFCPKARAPKDVNFHLLLSSVRPIIFLSLFKMSSNSLSVERGRQKSLSFPFFFSCRERPLLIELIGIPNSFTWRGGGHPDPEISGGEGLRPQKKFFSALRASSWSINKGGGALVMTFVTVSTLKWS